jgi:hypothetical protein
MSDEEAMRELEQLADEERGHNPRGAAGVHTRLDRRPTQADARGA